MPDFDYSLLRTSTQVIEIIEKAREVCRKKLQEHEYRLEEGRRKKLEEICGEACMNRC